MRLINIKWITLLLLIFVALFFYINKIKTQERALLLSKNASEIYINSKDVYKAKLLYEESIKLDKDIKTYTSYAQMYCFEGDVDKAFSILHGAESYLDLDYTTFFMLGVYADLLNRRELAIKYYNKSIEKTPQEDINRILTLYFIDRERNLTEFNNVEYTRSNQVIINYIRDKSMSVYVDEFIRDTCGKNN